MVTTQLTQRLARANPHRQPPISRTTRNPVTSSAVPECETVRSGLQDSMRSVRAPPTARSVEPSFAHSRALPTLLYRPHAFGSPVLTPRNRAPLLGLLGLPTRQLRSPFCGRPCAFAAHSHSAVVGSR